MESGVDKNPKETDQDPSTSSSAAAGSESARSTQQNGGSVSRYPRRQMPRPYCQNTPEIVGFLKDPRSFGPGSLEEKRYRASGNLPNMIMKSMQAPLAHSSLEKSWSKYIKLFCPFHIVPFDSLVALAMPVQYRSKKKLAKSTGELSSMVEYDSSIDHRLPETVKLITTTEGVKIYLIGTAHYSEASQNDVKMIMEAVKPQAVLVELCKLRADILKFDDNSVLLPQNISYSYMIDTIKKNGAYIGLFHLLLIHMTAKLSDQLDMLPGGEFRKAFEEAQKIPNCPVYLADRPLNITIRRTVSNMSLYEMLRFIVLLLTMNTDVSKEEVELHKQQSQVNEFEENLRTHFPALNEVFVKERDMYLSYMFQACIAHRSATHGEMPRRVVGVVGLGHSLGIIQNWGKVSIEDAQRLLSIPPEAHSTKILRLTFKATLIGAFAYMGYRYIPFSSDFVLKSLKSSVDGLKNFGLLVCGRLL